MFSIERCYVNVSQTLLGCDLICGLLAIDKVILRCTKFILTWIGTDLGRNALNSSVCCTYHIYPEPQTTFFLQRTQSHVSVCTLHCTVLEHFAVWARSNLWCIPRLKAISLILLNRIFSPIPFVPDVFNNNKEKSFHNNRLGIKNLLWSHKNQQSKMISICKKKNRGHILTGFCYAR